MKKIILLIIILTATKLFAQQYNNEWIDYNKTYYKFKVGATGLHRISQTTLNNTGLGTVNVAQFQLWRNGVEVPIYTSSQSGSLPADGYIEFWAEKNDGKPDLPLYRNAADQLNDSKSLITDTAYYFLTVNAVGNNKRLFPTSNVIPAGAVPELYFMHTAGVYLGELIHMGKPEGTVFTSSYEHGEGWTSSDIEANQSRSFTLQLLNAYNGANAPVSNVKLNAVGNGFYNKTIKLSLNGTDIFNSSVNGYNYVKLNAEINTTLINGTTDVVSIQNINTNNDRLRVAFFDITYPHNFNLGGVSSFRFKLPAKQTGTYLEISGINNAGIPLVYDLANGKRYEVDAANPGLLKVFLQPTDKDQDIVIIGQVSSSYNTISSFETRNFVNYLAANNQGDYLMITHSNILTGSNGSHPVEDYMTYRASAIGGGFNAKVFMIDQLVDQFSFGIKQHPLAVRNFIRYARNKFSNPIKHVLLIGKGVNYYSARLNETEPKLQQLNIVPTFGYPSSDVLLTAEGSSSRILASIGRVSVVTGDELTTYLNKVKEYENRLVSFSPSIQESSWKKQVIHMVGSNAQSEINDLYNALNRHKLVIQDTFYGANVTDFVKSYSTDVQETNTERLARRINDGAGYLTYFGHSSATTLGFNLEDPNNYQNPGKYPIFNMMGCDAGNIFDLDINRATTLQTISEKYVLAKNRGSVGMMAGTSLGFISTLDVFNTNFSSLLSKANYTNSIGELMKNTVNRIYDQQGEGSQLQRMQGEQYTLHGDPAIKFYQFTKPDYAVDDQQVVVSPSFVSIADTSFKVVAKFFNLGKAISDKTVIEVKRILPDLNTYVLRRDTIKGIRYIDSLEYNIPIRPTTDKGANKIVITIDPENRVDELFETNNSITKDIYIFEDEVRPVSPYNLSIVNNQGVLFYASSANPLSGSRTYKFEIDTTMKFNSNLKVVKSKVSTGGLIDFDASLTFQENTVYYWRVGIEPTAAGESIRWNNSSFVYKSGDNVGFNQSHYYQFLKNDNFQILFDSIGNRRYAKKQFEIVVKNGMWYTAIRNAADLTVEINDIVRTSNTCNWGLIFNVYDKHTLLPWINKVLPSGTGLYNSLPPNCGESRLSNFEFNNNLDGRNKALEFLKQIPDSSLVVLRTQMNTYGSNEFVEQWKADQNTFGSGNTLYDELKKQGLIEIDSLNRLRALSFVYRKNFISEFKPTYMFSDGLYDPIWLKTKDSAYVGFGTESSFEVGPAKGWGKFVWEGASLEANSMDSTFVNVIGVDKNGAENVLLQNIPVSQKETDLSHINANQYPIMKLKMFNYDLKDYTPYQLKYWRLFYNPYPEGAIAPNIYFAVKDTYDFGEPITAGLSFKNVSKYNFDSLKVKLSIRDRNNVENIIPLSKQKPLVSEDSIKLSSIVDSKKYIGKNTIYFDFNPDNDQPEQNHYNNFLYKDFSVRNDSINPYMDVTFDGVHILNKDIVSSKPDIQIKVTDDSKWALLNNPELVKIQLKFPNGEIRQFNYNSDTLVFEPPTLGNNNTARISFKPHLLTDGTYELQVAAKDQKGNEAGILEYRVAFQVINKPMISNMLNYPNPFTTSTAFVFTLTGSEVPQNIRIQILTITGKIVKEITKAELGPIKIGRNITEYKWDGTDQYGQKLANGVYLYRVITNLNGKSLEKYQPNGDNTDRFFNNGYGKMYLMR